MLRRTLLVAALFASTSFVVSCKPSTPANSDKTTEVTIAQWGSENYLIYLPVYIALEAGIFEKNGLEVKISYSGNDDQVFAKVLRGDAQFGVGDPIFTAVSRQQGADGVVIASIVDRVSLWGVAKNDVDGPIDFSGKRIGTFPRPSTAYTLLSDTLSNPEIENAKIVEIPIGNELALLESGQADIAMMLEPAASIAEENGYFVVSSFPEIWGKFAFTGLTSTQEVLSKNPGLAEKMKVSLQEAVDLAHSDREQAFEISKKVFPTLSQSVIESAVNRMLDDETLPRNVDVDIEAWKASIEVRQRVGDVNKGFECLECVVK